MSAQTLPSSALWEVARNLSLKELRRVKAESAGTRLEWLLTTLRSMETYSDEALHSAFAAAFPGINKGSLRTYKKQLWIVLERTLPSYDAEGIGTEVQLWHRLWLSILLWQRGNAHAARILWQQAIEKSTKTGWYEPASWSFSLTPPLLKERNMDKERIMDFDYFRKSRMHTLFSPCRKYGMALGLGLLYAQAPEADLKVICLERKADGSYQEIGRSSCSPERKDPCFSFIETCTQRGYVAVVSSPGVLSGEEERALLHSLSLYLGGQDSPPLRMEIRRFHRHPFMERWDFDARYDTLEKRLEFHLRRMDSLLRDSLQVKSWRFHLQLPPEEVDTLENKQKPLPYERAPLQNPDRAPKQRRGRPPENLPEKEE